MTGCISQWFFDILKLSRARAVDIQYLPIGWLDNIGHHGHHHGISYAQSSANKTKNTSEPYRTQRENLRRRADNYGPVRVEQQPEDAHQQYCFPAKPGTVSQAAIRY